MGALKAPAYSPRVMEPTAQTTAACKHRWVLGQPSQGVVPGRCRFCGAERDYPAVLDDYDNGYGAERGNFTADLLGTGDGVARPSSVARLVGLLPESDS